eukprot:563601-Rhodomonas_salina.2
MQPSGSKLDLFRSFEFGSQRTSTLRAGTKPCSSASRILPVPRLLPAIRSERSDSHPFAALKRHTLSQCRSAAYIGDTTRRTHTHRQCTAQKSTRHETQIVPVHGTMLGSYSRLHTTERMHRMTGMLPREGTRRLAAP